MWIGIILMCTEPSALSCSIMAKSEAFYSEESCLKEADQVATALLNQGVYAVPHCHKVGESA